MNGFERLQKALNFQEADRIPFDLSGTNVTAFSKYAYEAAMKFRDFPAKYDQKLVDPIQQIIIPNPEIMNLLQIDTYRIGARRIMNFEENLIEKEDHYSIIDHYQCEWRMKKEGHLYYNQCGYPLYDFDSLSRALEDFSIYDISSFKDTLTKDIESQLANVGERGIVLDRNCAGITEVSLRLRGYDKWFMDTILDPSGVDRLLDLLVEHKIAYWDLLINIIKENGIDGRVLAIAEADDLGTQTSLLLDPDTLKNLVIPKESKIFRYIKSRLPHAKVFFHSDGAIKSIIPDLLDAGVEILNPIQYSAAGMDLATLKKEYGTDMVLWGGGIDTQEILNKGSVQQVKEEIKRNIEILAPGGGFVFATVHNIQADVPPQNFWAMWETLMDFGKY